LCEGKDAFSVVVVFGFCGYATETDELYSLKADISFLKDKAGERKMKSKVFSGMMLIILLTSMLYAMSNLGRMVKGWSNGGFSSDPNNPDYGTHD